MKKALVFLFILILIGYTAFLFVMPHYNYYAFKSDTIQLMQTSIGQPKKIKSRIMDYAYKYDIPIEKKDIDLQRQKRYVVKISWEETVNLFNLYQKTYTFHIDTAKQ